MYIIYESNSGYTKQYAQMLAGKTGLEAYALSDAQAKVEKGSDAIFMGWLMAGSIQGYKKAAKLYNIKAVCAVGMDDSQEQLDGIKKASGIKLPMFILQGGFDINKLSGMYKFMMKTMMRTVGKKLANKPDRTPAEDDQLDLLTNGGSRVSEEKLQPVVDWVKAN